MMTISSDGDDDDDDDDDVVVRPICFGDHLNNIVQVFMMQQQYFPSKTRVSQYLFVASIHFKAEPVLQPQKTSMGTPKWWCFRCEVATSYWKKGEHWEAWLEMTPPQEKVAYMG